MSQSRLAARCPDTRAWHEDIEDILYKLGAPVRFLRGRARFVGAAHPPPLPRAVVVFWPVTGAGDRAVTITCQAWLASPGI